MKSQMPFFSGKGKKKVSKYNMGNIFLISPRKISMIFHNNKYNIDGLLVYQG